MQNLKINILLKKIAFAGIIFIFETFIPLLAGFELIIAFFLNYIVSGLLYLLGIKGINEYFNMAMLFILGAAFIVLLHVLYHVLIDGIFEISLLIEMNIELFAVFLLYSLPDSVLKIIIRNYTPGDEIMKMEKYLFLAAAVLYAVILAGFFGVKYLKKKKLASKIKSLEDEVL